MIDFEKLKKESITQDDGSLAYMFKWTEGEKVSYRASMNIFPYLSREIPKDTFDEWLQFCEEIGPIKESPNCIMYKAKHWSKI